MRPPPLLASFACLAPFVYFASLASLPAAEPSLTHVYPPAIQRGTTAEVHLVGTFDPWPCDVWFEAPGIVFAAGEEAGRGSIEVPDATPSGPVSIRAFNAEGASAPIALVIADTPQTLEVEPNDDFRAPQEVAGPVATVNGRHEKRGDVDSFAVTLRQGQVLVARVEAYELAAGFDAMVHVRDEAGRVLAFNHDHVTMDPFLAFTAPRDGKYIVQTMGHAYPASTEIRFAGGETCVYRLHLSSEAVVRNTWPMAVTRGQPADLTLEGWNLNGHTALRFDPAASVPASVPVVFSDVAETVESGDARRLSIPSAVSGRLDKRGEEDRYVFHAAKDAELEIAVTGRGQGSEIDPRLKILDDTGKEMASNDDDGGSLEARLVWTAPADGEYTAVVGDVAQRGGETIYYRLSVAPPVPSVQASTPDHAVKAQVGKSAEIKTKLSPRHGFKEKLRLVALDLPPGVTAADVEVPEAGGDITLTLDVAPDAAPAGKPVRLVLREPETGREHPVLYHIATTSEDNGVPQGYQKLLIDSTDRIWLTVTP